MAVPFGMQAVWLLHFYRSRSLYGRGDYNGGKLDATLVKLQLYRLGDGNEELNLTKWFLKSQALKKSCTN